MLIGSFVMKFKAIGNVMFWVQAKAMAVPLAIGAAIIGAMLLIDDFIGWQQGKISGMGAIFGRYEDFNIDKPFENFKMPFADAFDFDANEIWSFMKSEVVKLKELWVNEFEDLLKEIFLNQDTSFSFGQLGESKFKQPEQGEEKADFRQRANAIGQFFGLSQSGEKEVGFWQRLDAIGQIFGLGGDSTMNRDPASKGLGGATINNNKYETTVNVPQGYSVEQSKEMISDALRETAAKTPATTDQ